MSGSNRPLLLAFAMLPCLVVAAGAWLVVPQFREMLTNFGAELPWPTTVLLRTYRVWALLALLPMALWSGWLPLRDREAAAVICGSVLAAVMLAFSVFALYWPIFRLAATAG